MKLIEIMRVDDNNDNDEEEEDEEEEDRPKISNYL